MIGRQSVPVNAAQFWSSPAVGILSRSEWGDGEPEKTAPPLSAAVSKASAGAMEAVRVHACPNLPRTLSEAAAKGWAVLGASAEAESEDCSAVAVSKPTVLVVGSEGDYNSKHIPAHRP